MANWAILEAGDLRNCWDFIYENLQFKPHAGENEQIQLPTPNLSFDISNYYNDGYREDLYLDLHKKARSWFQEISKNRIMYAVVWQHEGFSFNPDLVFEVDEFDEWLVPVFPNGDYTFFLTGDFLNGIFADGIHLIIRIWGVDIIEAFKKNTPSILDNVLTRGI